jgi:2-methylaconitate cis-trans-isomerase PrpF
MKVRSPRRVLRGGDLVFNAADLPSDQARWDSLFCAAMGSPDGNGRQLDGMGGGLSSLSKVCVVGRPSRADADVDYTFAQVSIRDARIDMSGNCGNMSSAIGPFAVDEGLITAADGRATIRIHNINTQKIIHSSFSARRSRHRAWRLRFQRGRGGAPISSNSSTGRPITGKLRRPGTPPRSSTFPASPMCR